jgi:hypothetical protein
MKGAFPTCTFLHHLKGRIYPLYEVDNGKGFKIENVEYSVYLRFSNFRKARRKENTHMATIKIILDKRASYTTVDSKHQLVIKIGHKSKTRNIGFDIHLTADQPSFTPFKIVGIVNAESYTKRTTKIFGEIEKMEP